MAENETPETQDTQEPVFSIQRVYLKEVSLEQPNSPAIFLEQDGPSMDMQLGVEANQIADGVYEVVVTTTVQTKIKERTLFLIEAKQAGIFEVRNLPTDQTDRVLGISCPQIVYPYLRSNVADIIQRTGLPPIHLGEINFQALYEQRQEEQGGTGEAAEANAKDTLQ